ncbi:hypothetical protein HBI84_188220 [Parastagonospora nodorum]|nr:hypothetical protein HBI84_188220 [Parastagonospora nodorum]
MVFRFSLLPFDFSIKQSHDYQPTYHRFIQYKTLQSTSHFLNSKPTLNMSAMTQNRQQVYVWDGFSEPMSAQHNFANNFDLDNPDAAMSAYQRIMHEHTKRQLSTATDSARRRSGSSSNAESRSLESVSSQES